MADKFKVEPVEIPSDDCVLYIGRVIKEGKIAKEGRAVKIHEGESVWIVPVQTLRESIAISRIASIAIGDGKQLEGIGDALDTLCGELAKRVVRWTWTGLDGVRLPDPYKQPEVIKGLANEELLWLLTAAQGETEGMRKNGYTALPVTSSTSMETLQPPVKGL